MKKFWDWIWRRKTAPRPLSHQLQPLILRTNDSLPVRETFTQGASQIEEAEASMNVAVRSVVNVMAIEGLITRDQAKEFLETHTVVVAYRGCGLSGLLKGIGVSEDDIKANRSRVMVVRLPVRDHYTGNRRD